MAVGVGLIGAGGIGNVHARSCGLARGARLVAVADQDEERARRLAEEGGASAYGDYRVLLADPDVDAVIVATPPASHEEVVRAAIAAGKHVFCEKPIAPEPEAARRIVTMAESSTRAFMVGFQERFNLPNLEARDMMRGGVLGPLSYVRMNGRVSLKTFGKGGGWLADRSRGGGVILEASVHYWDLARWYSGAEITSVSALARSERVEGRTDDRTVAAVASLSDGSFLLLDLSFDMPDGFPMDQRVELIGRDGVLYLDMFRSFMTLSTGNPIDIGRQFMRARGIVHPDVFRQSQRFGAYLREIEHFVECVETGARPQATAIDGLRALEAAWAAARSADAGGTLVRVEHA